MEPMALKPCLFNCVVYCEKQERLDYCLDLMRTLASYFPCRLFVIHRLEESLKGQYKESRELYEKGADFYDALLVEASKDQLHRVPFALFPFLVPELPIVLFWDCDPTCEQTVLPVILPYANRLIFDSETVEPLFSFARRVLALVDEKRRLDLNWARLSGWRELLSKVFDTQERIEQLRAASDLRLFYNARENRFFHHSQTQALYLQAWLAAQMQWQYEGLGSAPDLTRRSIYRCGSDPVRVTVQPLYVEQRAPGSLLCIEMVSRLGTEVSIDSRGLLGAVRVKSVCDASCTLPYSLPLRGSRLNHRFFQQLLYQDVGSHYYAMLNALAMQE